jgi:hypothetical protein
LTHKKLNNGQQADLMDKMKKNIKSVMDKAEEEGHFDEKNEEASGATNGDSRVEGERTAETSSGVAAERAASTAGGGSSKKGGKKGKKGKVRARLLPIDSAWWIEHGG